MKNFLVDFFGWEDFDHGLFRVLCDENWEGGGGGVRVMVDKPTQHLSGKLNDQLRSKIQE